MGDVPRINPASGNQVVPVNRDLEIRSYMRQSAKRLLPTPLGHATPLIRKPSVVTGYIHMGMPLEPCRRSA